MSILQFILAYMIICTLFPLIEKITELLVSVIQLATAHIALRLHTLKEKMNNISSQNSQVQAIGFRYDNVDIELEEDSEEDC